MKYTPQEVAYAIRPERIGGLAYVNLCADGETLLVKNIDLYAREMAERGHYIEVVTNLTVTPVLNKFLSWPKEMLKHLEFKCSFHYLELKKNNKLELFAQNVKKIWEAGASANIEITPSDELIPYIHEVIEFSRSNFGALPHLTIARDDRTDDITILSKLSDEDYEKTWSQFESEFWRFKRTIFGKYQNEFCYAGQWSVYADLTTGDSKQCYCGKYIGNIFENPEAPFPQTAIGRCPQAHCYNGHALLTLGLIPKRSDPGYGDLRDRETSNGQHWLRPQLRDFFNNRLKENNRELSEIEQSLILAKQRLRHSLSLAYHKLRHGFPNL